jgi:hypothetical protein
MQHLKRNHENDEMKYNFKYLKVKKATLFDFIGNLFDVNGILFIYVIFKAS